MPSLAPYPRCRYLESGLCISHSSLRACAILHHGGGEPELAPYRGGPFPFEALDRARSELITANANARATTCRGCPNLIPSDAPPETGALIRWLTLTHWIACNLACDYCWLQWAPYAPRYQPPGHVPARFFDLRGPVLELIRSGRLAQNATVDWGGGGEPTLAPEFGELFVALNRHGATQWLHTNATRLPAAVLTEGLDPKRIHVVSSIDAGTGAMYAAIKGRDLTPVVWSNLARYRQLGVAVTCKYIVNERNGGRREAAEFSRRVRDLGVTYVLADIDHRHPEPSARVLVGLAHLAEEAANIGLGFLFGFTGGNSAPEHRIPDRIAALRERMRRVPGVPSAI